ncbi:hypothetical protein MycrhN_6099 [Mycolicibacterium rhodesiae NBB3]|uniref:Uncharacterized protein n=1 Tax=Mycolicibacterium rhodesiae (strain NBB3) TaxID=710685 RepID=G8RSM7_MYCRN|nr:hypothetical protein [Mycolicibacterium rhodesiae]AEV76560.1 hypothetical protein MycrhN_6099 [Mycolicibacterium rhodesiae NBB3]
MRAAAGACALSVGLLVCSSGGAVAVADSTDTGGTSTESQSGSSTATNKGPTTIREALIALRDAFAPTSSDSNTSTSTSPTTIIGNQRVDEQPVDGTATTTQTTTTTDLTNGQGPTATLAAQTNTTQRQEGVSTLTTGTEVTGAESTSVVSTAVVEALTPILDTLAPSTQPVAAPLSPSSTPTDPTKSTDPEESGAAAALAAAGKSGSPTATPAAKTPASLQSAVVDPLSGAVTTLVRAFGTAGMTLVSLPVSQNPIGDVITAVQVLLTAVVDAVSEVAKVPGNLLNLLGFSDADGVRPPVFGNGGSTNRVATTPVGVRLVGNEAQLPQATTVAVDAPLFGNVVNASEFGGIAPISLNQDFATSGLAPAPASVSPATKSFLDNIVRSVLVPASLTALAAIAVPGIAGLLIVCAAGIKVGYRQAKAGLALKLSGIARFAGSGPMGVVRSGSMIALHPRTSTLGKAHGTHAGRDKTVSAARHLERVA